MRSIHRIRRAECRERDREDDEAREGSLGHIRQSDAARASERRKRISSASVTLWPTSPRIVHPHNGVPSCVAERMQMRGDDASIAIEVSGYERPPVADPWDLNWLNCSVELSVGRFTGRYPAAFLTGEFATFRDALSAALESNCGRATFDALEGALSFTVELRLTGRALVTGRAQVRAATSAEFAFSFETDPTFLVETAKGADAVLREFPERR